MSFCGNALFVWIWLLEMSNQKIKFDGMFKMLGLSFEKFLFLAEKWPNLEILAANPKNRFGVPFLISCTICDHVLRSIVLKDFHQIFFKFKGVYKPRELC